MTTLVYQYGLLPPTEGADIVRAQIRHAYEYRVALVGLDTARRDEVRAFDARHGGVALRSAEQRASVTLAAKEVAWQALKADRKKSRSRSESESMKAEVARTRAEHTGAMGALREARRVYREAMTERVKKDKACIYERHAEAMKKLAAETPTYWGTKGLMMKAHDQANEDNPAIYDELKPNNLKRPRWDGTGSLGVQVQKGASPATLMGEESTNTLVRILRASNEPVLVPARLLHSGKHAGEMRPAHLRQPGKRDRRVLWLRVGSNEDRTPIWAAFPMMYDRPLPAGAVKAVVVRCKKIGPPRPGHPYSNEHWTVGFSIDLAETPAVCGQGAVAVDVGWRLLPNGGLRVAAAMGEDGHAEELVLPARWLGRIEYTESVRAIKDRTFDYVRAALVEFRKRVIAEASSSEGPSIEGPSVSVGRLDSIHRDWFLETTEHLALWRNAGKLERVLRTWGTEHRFPGDEIFDAFEWWGQAKRDAHWRPGLLGWVTQDRHLWEMESHLRSKALNWRKDFYRNWAARLADRYDTVVFEEFDKRPVALKKDEYENETARGHRQLASTSELEGVTRQAFVRRGGCGHAFVDPVDSTHECNECGHVDKFDAAEKILHACSSCGVVWDQDDNSAKVLLARWLGQRTGAPTPGPSQGGPKCGECHGVRENHFAKLKRLKREKLEKLEKGEGADGDARNLELEAAQ